MEHNGTGYSVVETAVLQRPPLMKRSKRRLQREAAMPEVTTAATADRATWRVGQRVSRNNTDELGTVVKINGSIKVKWDGGSTSYFRHGIPGNIQLKPPLQQ
jgi:hypothetical protein